MILYPEPSPSKHNTATNHSDPEQNDTHSDDSEQEEDNDSQTTPIRLKNKVERLSAENCPDISMTIREHTRQLGKKNQSHDELAKHPYNLPSNHQTQNNQPYRNRKAQAESSPAQNPPKKPHK